MRNRSIRAAAFEGMTPNHNVSQQLIDYHRAVAAGDIGMTTVAYAAVNESGLSFPHQLWLRPDSVQQLRPLTDAVHAEHAAVSIQIGHCGNMSKHSLKGPRPVSASARINWYAPSFPRALSEHDIIATAKDFGKAVRLAQEAGFDAVEVHAGHGYLISQFLSPYTNHRRDAYGGSLANRMRFMQQVMTEVLEAAAGKTAVLVKMNMRDGFEGGMQTAESLEVANELQRLGAHALVLSGGFVSRAPMYVMRGAMPLHTLAQHMPNRFMGWFVELFGKGLVPEAPFKENYFMADALLFRRALQMPLVYIGGILSKQNIDEALDAGFDAVAIARALIRDPEFINKILKEQQVHSPCDTCNYCVASIYDGPFSCIQTQPA